MILITKTSDQTRQRGHSLSTLVICVLGALLLPLYSFIFSKEACLFVCTHMRDFLLVSRLRPMSLNVLGYLSHLLQRWDPVWGHYVEPSHLSPVVSLNVNSSALFHLVNRR